LVVGADEVEEAVGGDVKDAGGLDLFDGGLCCVVIEEMSCLIQLHHLLIQVFRLS
jgi:hypothetical protein